MEDPVLRRKLDVLQCPIDGGTEEALQKVVNWLEDTHIRRYIADGRKHLRSISEFPTALTTYCRALGLPLSAAGSAKAALPYLVDTALALHYSDCADVYNAPVDPWAGRAVPVIDGAAKDTDVTARARKVLEQLGFELPQGVEELDAADIVEMVADIAEAGMKKLDDTDDEVDLEQVPLGFSTGNAQVDRTAAVIRLLHIRDLHKLQNAINDAVADMQAVTANPKTDSRLGRVGR